MNALLLNTNINLIEYGYKPASRSELTKIFLGLITIRLLNNRADSLSEAVILVRTRLKNELFRKGDWPGHNRITIVRNHLRAYDPSSTHPDSGQPFFKVKELIDRLTFCSGNSHYDLETRTLTQPSHF